MPRALLGLTLLAACGGGGAAPRGPVEVSNQGGGGPVPAASGERLDGPFDRLEQATAIAAARVDAAAAGETLALTLLRAATIVGVGQVALVELRAHLSSADCAVAIETAHGWYLGPAFWCARDTSDGTLTVRVEIAPHDARARLVLRFEADNAAAGAIGGDGKVDAVSEHVIDCGLSEGQPACSPPPALEP